MVCGPNKDAKPARGKPGAVKVCRRLQKEKAIWSFDEVLRDIPGTE